MKIFNQWGATTREAENVATKASAAAFAVLKPFMDQLPLYEARAIESVINQSMGLRYAEYRLRRAMKEKKASDEAGRASSSKLPKD